MRSLQVAASRVFSFTVLELFLRVNSDLETSEKLDGVLKFRSFATLAFEGLAEKLHDLKTENLKHVSRFFIPNVK